MPFCLTDPCGNCGCCTVIACRPDESGCHKSIEADLYAIYDRSLERLVMIDEPVAEQVRAAFEAGRVAERERVSGLG